MSNEVIALYVVVSFLVVVTVIFGLSYTGLRKELDYLNKRIEDKLPGHYGDRIWENRRCIDHLAKHFNLQFSTKPQRIVLEKLEDSGDE